MGIGNRHLAMTMLIMAVGNNHKLILKLVDYCVLRNRIFAKSQAVCEVSSL